jgi:hypothetical protein
MDTSDEASDIRLMTSPTGTVVPLRKLSAGRTEASSCETVVDSDPNGTAIVSGANRASLSLGYHRSKTRDQRGEAQQRDANGGLHYAITRERACSQVYLLHASTASTAEHTRLMIMGVVKEVSLWTEKLADSPKEW